MVANSSRVAELERKLNWLELETARQAAAIREELLQVQRAQTLELQLQALEARYAIETAQLRRELERARGGARETPPLRREAAPEAEPPTSLATRRRPQPLWALALKLQIPTLLVGVCLLPVPLFAALLAAPVCAAMVISTIASYLIERRSGDVWRHQIAPAVVLQPVIVLYAYVAGTFSLSSNHRLRVDEFMAALGILEAGYLVAVALPVALVFRAAARG